MPPLRPLLLVSLLLLSACGSTGPTGIPTLGIAGTRVENRSSGFLTAVRVIVPETGNFVSCGNIAPGSYCSTSFPELAYSGNPVEVSWSQSGQIYSTGLLDLVPDESVLEARQALVQVVIVGPGLAGVVLLPQPR